jgi:hypothetical protein
MEQAALFRSQSQTEAAFASAGFSIKTSAPYEVADDLRDCFCTPVTQPEVCLDAKVRAGISAFACARDQAEIVRGVERLVEEIHTGRISNVMCKYAWKGGDYMFTVAIK